MTTDPLTPRPSGIQPFSNSILAVKLQRESRTSVLLRASGTAESGHGRRLSHALIRLTVRASPPGWCLMEGLLEGAGECGFRVVANSLGDLCERCVSVAELLTRDLHAPTGEIVHRRHADETDEAVS